MIKNTLKVSNPYSVTDRRYNDAVELVARAQSALDRIEDKFVTDTTPLFGPELDNLLKAAELKSRIWTWAVLFAHYGFTDTFNNSVDIPFKAKISDAENFLNALE